MTHYLPHALAVVFFLLYLRQRGKAKAAQALVEDLAETLRERVLQAYSLVQTCEDLTRGLRSATATANAALQRSQVFEGLAERTNELAKVLTLRQQIAAQFLRVESPVSVKRALEALQGEEEGESRPH